MPLTLYFIFVIVLTTLNEKTKNKKVVDFIKIYNFLIKIIFIRCHIEEI